MKISQNPAIVLVLLLFYISAHAIVPQRSGWWKFDDPSNLRKAEAGFGVDLTLIGAQLAATGPEANNGAVVIGSGSYYKMQHQVLPNGGGAYVNEYSLQFDFKVPDDGAWHSFFQTSTTNSNDGDFFINPSGNIGVAAVGYSSYAVLPDEWYRMVISVKNGSFFTCYLDGQLLLSGNVQAIDGRFSLENLLLVFADDNGEDGTISCAELGIWNQSLSADQVMEMGGYGHKLAPAMMTRIPYLQGQSINSISICWHDIAQTGTKVQFGVDSVSLNSETFGSSEIISDPYRWHTVKLTGLQADTRYFYRVASGGAESGIYSFRTLPDSSYTGKLRFVLLSDTHANDTTMAGKVLRAARAKIEELYGPEIENHVNGIFHSGDIVVSGSTPSQYSKQFFAPLSALSANIPTMVVAGNHEIESPYFYQYLKLEDQSAFPKTSALNEKIWQLKAGNSLFIGLNTNIIDQYGETQANWLDSRLNEAENDTTIDFVFVFFHHPPFSELWIVGGTDYVKNRLIPVMEKYSKVQEIHYGHTHGFERGTITSVNPGGDFRMVCSGGGGGPLDPWVQGENQDYNDIHITISNYFYQILEIDIANQSYQNSVYSLGTLYDSKNSELIDRWHKAKNQSGPETPSIENIEQIGEFVQVTSSEFSGIDSLMSVQFQVIDSSQSTPVVTDSVTHWENIYGIDANSKPVDLNRNVNLYQSKIKRTILADGKEYFFRVRYRDHNLKWSNWSELAPYKAVGISENSDLQNGYFLSQNFPNPFVNETSITYQILEKGEVVFRIFDESKHLIAKIDAGLQNAGTYTLHYNGKKLSNGVYIYEMRTGNHSMAKKMTIIK